jgi:hypothetical protein
MLRAGSDGRWNGRCRGLRTHRTWDSTMKVWMQILCQSVMMLVLVIADTHFGRCADDGQKPSENSYVREATVTYYGLNGTRSQELSTRRDIALCEISMRGGQVNSDERFVVAFRDQNGTNANANQILRSEDRFDLKEGLISPFSKTELISDMPYVGFELFYFPMFDLREGAKGAAISSRDGIVALRTGKQFTPEFKGQWVFTIREEASRVRISGPYLLETSNGGWVMAGSFDHEISLSPFRVLRMSGEALVRISPKAKELAPVGTVAGNAERWSKFDEIVGRFKFVMVPAASREAKNIKIPDVLRKADTVNAK